jgi:hypothetical protein
MPDDLPVQGKEVYLGDGVYAGFDGYQIWLRTHHSDRPDDRITLEPSVYRCLREWIEQYPRLAQHMESAHRGRSILG